MPLNIVKQSDKNSDLQFWLSKTESERISAIEFLREQFYVLSGYKTIPRLVPSCTIRKFHS